VRVRRVLPALYQRVVHFRLGRMGVPRNGREWSSRSIAPQYYTCASWDAMLRSSQVPSHIRMRHGGTTCDSWASSHRVPGIGIEPRS
jgi:hypothetical protein